MGAARWNRGDKERMHTVKRVVHTQAQRGKREWSTGVGKGFPQTWWRVEGVEWSEMWREVDA